MLSTLPIIVLAAGASSRMRGVDKMMEDVDGQPLIRKQALLARAVTSGEVIIALPPRPHARYDVLSDLAVTCHSVRDAAEGMNASLRCAFRALPCNAPAVMLLLGDMPDLTINDMNAILQAVDIKTDTLIWRGTNANGEHGHPIVFSAALFPAFAQLTGDTGGREVVAKAGSKVELIPLPDSDARADLDTPEEWRDWRKRREP